MAVMNNIFNNGAANNWSSNIFLIIDFGFLKGYFLSKNSFIINTCSNQIVILNYRMAVLDEFQCAEIKNHLFLVSTLLMPYWIKFYFALFNNKD
ncbi:hypothetical protein BpHYR1_034692 [Brachionus plicatilis]|uniref:Uncharacterized protein n=1 Tax=Brachionus plicatilis TaxID=10195 RepID=A0A3M7SH60_BRAPC|nr:hypothetical protein BpHYR1_034692 [Brachionus plicatilis]